MGIQIYQYINTDLQNSISTNETNSIANEASSNSEVTFADTLALAQEAYQKSAELDSGLAQTFLESLGTSGIAANAKIAYELGFTGSVAPVSNDNNTTAQASPAIAKSDNYTTKCPSHTGSSGYDNSGVLACADQYQTYFEQAAEATGVDVKLLKSVALAESSFNPNDVSSTGAVGIMQIMPETQADYGIQNAYDPQENILGGARILADKLEEFDGNLSRALSAYNAGSGAVKRAGGVPDYTWNYVSKITGYYNS